MNLDIVLPQKFGNQLVTELSYCRELAEKRFMVPIP
jgi:hypothetical protein